MTEHQIKVVMNLFEVDETTAIKLINVGVNPTVAEHGVNMVEDEMNGIVNRYTSAFNQFAQSVQSMSQEMEQSVRTQSQQDQR